MRDCDGEQERQHQVDVVRQLQREDHTGERRSHCAAEDGAHAHERPETRAFKREDVRFDTAKCCAHHQQRREHAAGCARPEREGPDRRLHDQHADDDASRKVVAKQPLDDVVADTEGLRKEQAAESDDEAADGRPPHPVNGEVLKRVFGGVHRLREHGRQQSGQRARNNTPHQRQRSNDRPERKPDNGAYERPWQRHDGEQQPRPAQNDDPLAHRVEPARPLAAKRHPRRKHQRHAVVNGQLRENQRRSH